MDIILYLLLFIQYQHKQICWLFNFICRYIPLKQWVFDDSHSPKYQKFKIDKLPKIIYYEKWDYKDYIPYLEWKYGKKIKPVSRRSECDIDLFYFMNPILNPICILAHYAYFTTLFSTFFVILFYFSLLFTHTSFQ